MPVLFVPLPLWGLGSGLVIPGWGFSSGALLVCWAVVGQVLMVVHIGPCIAQHSPSVNVCRRFGQQLHLKITLQETWVLAISGCYLRSVFNPDFEGMGILKEA